MLNIDENQHIFSHYTEDYCDNEYQNHTKCLHSNCFIAQVRYPDGSLKLRNPHLSDNTKSDYLYHLGFGTENALNEKYGDVKVSRQIIVLCHYLLVCLYGRNTTKNEVVCFLSISTN